MTPTNAKLLILDLRLMIAIWFAAVALLEYPSAVSHPQNSPTNLLTSPDVERRGFVGELACGPCHRDKFATYLVTAHHRTSRLPDVTSIAGSFTQGKNVMTTFNPEITFRMEARDGHFYQIAIRQKRGRISKRTEQIDLVVGSATKGQTYLYWKQNGLFELPVSYWTELHRWVNSPGYVDGSADFDRPVASSVTRHTSGPLLPHLPRITTTETILSLEFHVSGVTDWEWNTFRIIRRIQSARNQCRRSD